MIKTDITHPSLPRFSIFAEFGVPEVWRHDGVRLQIFPLDTGAYTEHDRRAVLPNLAAATITELLNVCHEMPRREWLRLVRERAHEA